MGFWKKIRAKIFFDYDVILRLHASIEISGGRIFINSLCRNFGTTCRSATKLVYAFKRFELYISYRKQVISRKYVLVKISDLYRALLVLYVLDCNKTVYQQKKEMISTNRTKL